MTLDPDTRLDYIEATAFSISDRLTRDTCDDRDRGLAALREDVAWVARAVAWLARLERDE